MKVNDISVQIVYDPVKIDVSFTISFKDNYMNLLKEYIKRESVINNKKLPSQILSLPYTNWYYTNSFKNVSYWVIWETIETYNILNKNSKLTICSETALIAGKSDRIAQIYEIWIVFWDNDTQQNEFMYLSELFRSISLSHSNKSLYYYDKNVDKRIKFPIF